MRSGSVAVAVAGWIVGMLPSLFINDQAPVQEEPLGASLPAANSPDWFIALTGAMGGVLGGLLLGAVTGLVARELQPPVDEQRRSHGGTLNTVAT